MELSFSQRLIAEVKQGLKSCLGAIEFYTILPLPQSWQREFTRVARWSPLVGLGIGLILSLSDTILLQLQLPVLTRTVLIVATWLIVTGGLHLDGAMDTADGLAVTDSQRRLEVMTDSRTGAFGVMAAIILIFLKVVTLTELPELRGWALMGAAGWGRWAQVVAISFYPYLKNTGKGAFHKQAIQVPQDLGLGLAILFGLSITLGSLLSWWLAILFTVLGVILSLSISLWFARVLGGYTGDVYGAVVEWTELAFLGFFLLTITHL